MSTPNVSLEEKLKEVVRLEKEHNLLGVSVCVKEPGSKVLTEDCVDYVLHTIRTGVALLARRHELPQLRELAP